MAGEVGLGEAMEGLEAFLVEGAFADEVLGEGLLTVPGPLAEGHGQRVPGDRVGEQREHGHQQIAIQLIHDGPLGSAQPGQDAGDGPRLEPDDFLNIIPRIAPCSETTGESDSRSVMASSPAGPRKRGQGGAGRLEAGERGSQ